MRMGMAAAIALFSVLAGLTPGLRSGLLGDDPLCKIDPTLAEETGCADWELGAIRAVGRAAPPDWATPPQAPLLALEGARTMAYARMTECVCGVRVAGGTKVQQAVTVDQETAIVVRGFIKGARVVQEEVLTVPGGINGVVTLEMRLLGDRGLGGQLPPRWPPAPSDPQPRRERRSTSPSFLPTPAIDALILDARGWQALPALYPQVLAEDRRTVYDWHSVGREHRDGFGRVTNDPEKAKALLHKQGATNPMVVKVARMEGSTTYIISPEDARRVIDADSTAQFLRKGRVVFVLGL